MGHRRRCCSIPLTEGLMSRQCTDCSGIFFSMATFNKHVCAAQASKTRSRKAVGQCRARGSSFSLVVLTGSSLRFVFRRGNTVRDRPRLH